ncbi:hypothetical protein [Arenibaculum sp.]|jgi:hypothetical protein|uniref:hypothetical protein n=1 Tax=Arenibaculum sp. TaxID=2865862 RepID=UPI002E1278E5|nr:hypothetical protein [Arenibaculum sp.]
MPTLAQAALRTRIRDDIDDTIDREDRAAILADCLISRLIEVTLKDRRDYLAYIENEIAGAFGSGQDQAVRRAVASRRREVLHFAIRDELMVTGMDQALWRSTMDRISDVADEAFTPETLERFLAICERRGWEPPVTFGRD